ncbi:MAG: hypothetical protein J0L65_05520, partial [Xanthomonadales bacterium]|nr:hypothetical protein [Xanthomonadales bacterium]
PSRGAPIGLVVMDTPTHGPLASTFGRQLLDLGEMPVADSATYVRVMMDLLVKSDVSRFSQLSGTGRSARVAVAAGRQRLQAIARRLEARQYALHHRLLKGQQTQHRAHACPRPKRSCRVSGMGWMSWPGRRSAKRCGVQL